MTRSRRDILASAAGLATLGVASGCQGTFARPEQAFLSYKGIDVRWVVDRTQGYAAELCWLWSDGRSRVFGWEPAAYPEIVRSATAVSVPEDTAQRLRNRFEGVAFVLGFSGVDATKLSLLESTFGQVAISREQFNRIQFTDRVRVARTGGGLRVRGVDPGGHGDLEDWEVTVGTKDLVEQFPDSEVPPPV